MKLKPVNDKIVVKPNSKEEEVTESGILLPDTVDQGKLMEGEVMAVGNGMYSASGTLIPVVVNVGETILYNKHAQTHEYGDYVIMKKIQVAKPGDTVVALVNGEATLKSYYVGSNGIELHPRNDKYHIIYVNEYDDFQIQGLVLGVFRKYE